MGWCAKAGWVRSARLPVSIYWHKGGKEGRGRGEWCARGRGWGSFTSQADESTRAYVHSRMHQHVHRRHIAQHRSHATSMYTGLRLSSAALMAASSCACASSTC
jgi:hypothetical protein